MGLQALVAAIVWLRLHQPVAGKKLNQHVMLEAEDALQIESGEGDLIDRRADKSENMDDLFAQWKQQQAEMGSPPLPMAALSAEESKEEEDASEDFTDTESVTPSVWAVIGPFKASEMGVDPLSAFGGIQKIVDRAPPGFWKVLRDRSEVIKECKHCSPQEALQFVQKKTTDSDIFSFPDNATDGIAEFPTERGPAGRSFWSVTYTMHSRWANVNFVSFANASGQDTGTFYPPTGHGGGWVVGEIHLDDATTVLAQCSRNFYVGSGGAAYFPDIYKEHRAVHALHLPAGRTRLFVHTFEPGFKCKLLKDSAAARKVLTAVPDESEGKSPFVVLSDYTISSVVESKIVSPHFGIPVINVHEKPLQIQSAEIRDGPANLKVHVAENPDIQPSQAMILRLKLSHEGDIECSTTKDGQHVLNFTVALVPGCTGCSPAVKRVVTACKKKASEGYIVAFPDFDGSIQRFWAAPPNLTRFNKKQCPPAGCPVVLSLHGAAVSMGPGWGNNYNYDSDISNATDGFPYPAWLVQPTNRWHWGTDWEGPGFDNAIAALNFAKEALPGAPGADSLEEKQKRTGLDATRVLVTGHSMGGHGCFVFSTHFPDQVVGAACASGWPSLNSYSYNSHTQLLDASRSGLLEAPRYEHAADFSASNLQGVPMLVIYGSKDNNVPPTEPRTMVRLVDSASPNTSLKDVELPNIPHWFSQNIPPMRSFFEEHLKPGDDADGTLRMPGLPKVFDFTVTSPETYGSRGNLQLLQQLDGSKPARFFVHRCRGVDDGCEDAMSALPNMEYSSAERDAIWQVDTFNVRRFTLKAPVPGREWPRALLVDGTMFAEDAIRLHEHGHFCRANPKEAWKICGAAGEGRSWEHLQRTAGPIHMALRRAPICIAHGSGSGQAEQAIFLANKMYFVSRYAPAIIDASKQTSVPSECSKANLLLLGSPSENSWVKNMKCSFPYLHFSEHGRGFSIDGHAYSASRSGLLALGSLPEGRLALLIHGVDAEGLAQAVTAVPVTSGRHGADYMVFGPDSGWKGEGGILAAGYLDSLWQVSSSSWGEPEHSTSPITHLVKDKVPAGLDPACAGQRTLLDASDEEISAGQSWTTRSASVHPTSPWHLLCGVLLLGVAVH